MTSLCHQMMIWKKWIWNKEVKHILMYLFIGMMIGAVAGILLGAFGASSYFESKEIERLSKELREARQG